MMENQPEKAIPNVIGRLDPVIDAIAIEDWTTAIMLCEEEIARRSADIARIELELNKKRDESRLITQFMNNIYNDEIREKILAEARK